MDVGAALREEQCADAPAEREGCYHSEHRDEEGGDPHLEHVADGGLETDLKEEDNHAELGEGVERHVRLERLDPRNAEQLEVPEEDASH